MIWCDVFAFFMCFGLRCKPPDKTHYQSQRLVRQWLNSERVYLVQGRITKKGWTRLYIRYIRYNSTTTYIGNLYFFKEK